MGLLCNAIHKHSCRSQHISVLTTSTFMLRQVCTIEPSFFSFFILIAIDFFIDKGDKFAELTLPHWIFSFGSCVIYHSKGLWEYIPKSILSVHLYHNLETNSWTSFLSWIFKFNVIHQWIPLTKLYKRMKIFF